MEMLSEVYYSSIARFKTHCCALAQLSINNSHDLFAIRDIIEELKENAKTKMTSSDSLNFGNHERAVFVITLPHETKLVSNLQELGFKEIAEFHRRPCYPEDSMLKMWILSW